MIKLSIITINYNNKEGLSRTIKSIIEQTWLKFEYIVIDGGSNDGSVDIIKCYSSNITYWISEKDTGVYNAMNKGIKIANGEYILFINSGDILHDNFSLSNINIHLNNFDIISFNLRVVGENIDFIKRYPHKVSFNYLIKDTLPHPASFIKKSLFDIVGYYDENLKIVSDWKWFIIALFKYNLSHIHYDNVISIFYLDGISSSNENNELIQKEKTHTFEKEFARFYLEYTSNLEKEEYYEKLKNNIIYKIIIKFYLLKDRIKKFIK